MISIIILYLNVPMYEASIKKRVIDKFPVSRRSSGLSLVCVGGLSRY